VLRRLFRPKKGESGEGLRGLYASPGVVGVILSGRVGWGSMGGAYRVLVERPGGRGPPGICAWVGGWYWTGFRGGEVGVCGLDASGSG
jgi:hypothetical protein